MLVCPPATLVHSVAEAVAGTPWPSAVRTATYRSRVPIPATSAVMLADSLAAHVIVGHSERRQNHGEDDALVSSKASAAHAAGLIAIICVGETLEQREAGKALDVVGSQVAGSIPAGATAANTVIAYEPVWAIGTGKTPAADVAEVMPISARQSTAKSRIPDRRASSTAVRSSRRMPRNCWRWTMSTAPWSAAPALVADDFWGIAETCR